MSPLSKKQTTRTTAKNEKKTTGEEDTNINSGVLLNETQELNKKRDSWDKGGVKRIYSPFNRFANNSTWVANQNKRATSMAYQSTYKSTGLSPKEKSYIICSCQTRSTRYLVLKNLASKAIEDRKIFTIYGYCNAARKALTERGWVEKIPPNRMNLSKIKNGTLSSKPEIHTELERLLLSSLVNKYTPTFIWHTKDEIADTSIDMTNKDCTIIENKLRTDALWTSKQGLCASMKRNYWFYIEDVSEVTGPRSYNTVDAGEIEDFAKDYKITACTSLLKWVVSMVANDRPVFVKAGKISLNIIVFALNRCKEYLFRKQNRDIDRNLNNTSPGQWNTFLKKYYRIIGKDDVFELDKENKLPLYLGYARFLLKEMYRYRPQLSCEGCYNIWIIKPAHNCRGRGIRMASKLAVITNLLNKANAKYVIQKYIEEPLLIYETKFDIRQYYLVTSTYPLVIWMYQDCYLKFSSQKYNLMDYHESIHLTNNAVQRKYTNCTQRHCDLPQNNMWDSDKYKKYLNKIGKDKVWDNVIYPGMRKSIIAIMLSCQDTLPVCKNRFELYGCDFILDKMYKPWLIEINSSPDLNHTTPVTAKICPAVISDIIKVVIDYPRNRNCSTGKFECIYRQPMTIPRYGPASDLYVRGYSLPDDYFYSGTIEHQKTIDDDSVDIEKSYNSEAILKKIKQYYDLDTIMVHPEEYGSGFLQMCENQSSSRVHSEQSEYQLSIAATIITTQLEELMDKIPSTSDIAKPKHLSISQAQSIKSETDVESIMKECISRIASIEIVSLLEDPPLKSNSLHGSSVDGERSLVKQSSHSLNSPHIGKIGKANLIAAPPLKVNENNDSALNVINKNREQSYFCKVRDDLTVKKSHTHETCKRNQHSCDFTSRADSIQELSLNHMQDAEQSNNINSTKIPPLECWHLNRGLRSKESLSQGSSNRFAQVCHEDEEKGELLDGIVRGITNTETLEHRPSYGFGQLRFGQLNHKEYNPPSTSLRHSDDNTREGIESTKYLNKRLTSSNYSSVSSKNIILEATAKLVDFISKKEKEYLCDWKQ
ncbi:protein monoglycylase TTLL8-like isoform X2 [Anticarsia gemmatalis]|uniref:protein monoglycylase TTLL8-like isoform X2 n=1 Tax=Anticarsia gemmatalis TaxID=129554 RepID=UPI003F75B78D